MKQVVISPSENVLNVYWFVQYMKLKEIDLYVYKEIRDKDTLDTIKYVKINEIDLDKNCIKIKEWCTYELYTKDLGKEISNSEIEKYYDDVIFHYDYTEDREDKDLITICEQANNEEMAKIVEIPDDIGYEIDTLECGIGEIVVEKHRVWR